MPKRGLPATIKMRHDSHYVDELTRANKTVGKVIKIDKIKPNPEQPRVEFGDLSELTSSIKEQGVLEPLLVKPVKETGEYMIIAGERRWRASNLAGLEEVPCIELDISEKAIAEIALVENLQRKDLTIWEISDGLADLKDRFGYTHDDIAKKIGKSRTTVTESLAIAGLPDDIRERCLKAKITSKSTLVEVSRQFDSAAMHDFLTQIETKGLSRKKAKTKKKNNYSNKKVETLENSNSTSDIIEEKSFKYKAKNNSFALTLNFNNKDFDNKDILLALKEAFEYVKHQ